MTVTELKVAQEQKRLAALESQTEETKEALSAKESELKLLTKGVKNAEQLVKEYCGDPETVLPKPDMLESGKAYRENKAAPILKGIQGMLRKIYGLYLNAKKSVNGLRWSWAKKSRQPSDCFAEMNFWKRKESSSMSLGKHLGQMS